MNELKITCYFKDILQFNEWKERADKFVSRKSNVSLDKFLVCDVFGDIDLFNALAQSRWCLNPIWIL